MKAIKNIESIDEWTEILNDNSGTINRVIFKNSNHCVISFSAFREFQKWAANLASDEPVELYVVDVINQRSISNHIAETLGVIHQSPQIIWINGGKVISHFSHYQITLDKLNEVYNSLEVPK